VRVAGAPHRMDRRSAGARGVAVVVSRLHDDRARRVERRARAAGARAGAPRAHPVADARDTGSQLSDHRRLARCPRRALHLHATRRRRHRVRAVSPPAQFDRARDAAAGGKERPHRPRRSLRHGPSPALRVRRRRGVSARRIGAPRRRNCGLRIADCGFDRGLEFRGTEIPNQSAIRDPQPAMTTFELLLIGYGHVAKRFESLLKERRTELERRYGIRARVIGTATRRDGCRYVGTSGPPEGGHDVRAVEFIRDACARHSAAARDGRLVVVETTTLDVERGEPAVSHVRTALAGGAHVITTNKGPAPFAYRSLIPAPDPAGRRFLFEGAVMDGVPIFNLVREALPAVAIVGFRGVVNSTTNYILTAMEQGQPFADALAEMQAMGIAEADPSLDVDGWDAAAKTSALANVLLGASMTPRQVERQGISPETGRLAREALAAGQRLKLVVRAGQEGDRLTARVAPESLAADDLLAGVEGQQNALILHTDLLGEIGVVQRSGSLTQTAYALLSDLVAIARDVTRAPAIPRSRPSGRPRRTP